MKMREIPDTFEELIKFIRKKFDIDSSKDIKLEFLVEEDEKKIISKADDYSKEILINIMNSGNKEINVIESKKKEKKEENGKNITKSAIDNKELKLKVDKLNKIILEKDDKIQTLENKNKQLLEETSNNIKAMKQFVDKYEKVQKKENELLEKEIYEYIKKSKNLEKENKELKNKLNGSNNNNKIIEIKEEKEKLTKDNNKKKIKQDDFEEIEREDFFDSNKKNDDIYGENILKIKDEKNEKESNKKKSDINDSNENQISSKKNKDSIYNEEDDESDEEMFDDSEEYLFEEKEENEDYKLIFGKTEEKCTKFLSVYQRLFSLSFELKTTFYTLSFRNVKNIIEDLKEKDKFTPLISDKLYSFVINNDEKIYKYYDSEDIYKAFDELFLVNPDFQVEIIKAIIRFCMLNSDFNNNNISYSFIKLFQDIGFCIRLLHYTLDSILYHDKYCYEYDFDIRILYYCNLIENLAYSTKYPSHLFKLATESAKIKDTIILGDIQFKNHIKELKLPNERINEVDDDKLDSFFQKPYIEKKKYKVVKYFVICEDKDLDNKYLEEFKNLSSKYGFAYLFLVYVNNKKLIDIKNDLKELKSIYYIFEDSELIEIYKDNNERLRPRLAGYLPENYSEYKKSMDELKEMVNEDIKDLKLTSEDGWDLFEYKKENYHLNFHILSACFHNFISHIIGNFIEAYKERNTLEFFFQYYSNYFFLTLQPEFLVNMTAFGKMFLYAYTLEERDPKKNLYCIINDDLRSSTAARINRHFELIKLIAGLIQTKRLKSYTGNVYRATYLKDELIPQIKVGLTMINSAFWSATKKESVAKKFLKESYKNALIITKGGLENNIDIHLEKMSKYPSEEEVLFLPFCNFKITNFEKVEEGKKSYYKIILENEGETTLIEPYSDKFIKKFNCEKEKKY